MALVNSFETSGNYLFRRRGYLPAVLFLVAVPVIYFTGYGWLTRELKLALTWISIIISALGFAIRAFTIGTTPRGTSGRNTGKQVAESLNTSGIYSAVRHPLYLGNYLMWLGIILFTFNFYFVVIVSLAFWIYYERIMFAEERFLERKFGQQYLDWSMRVHAFIPSFRKWEKPTVPFSFKSVLRREYSGFLVTVVSFVFIEVLRRSFAEGRFYIDNTTLVILAVAAVITLLLRSLKHYTRLLVEEGRS